MTPARTIPKPAARGQRPRCLYCTKELEPQFDEQVIPAKLQDGRRAAERAAWLKANPNKFSGHYGRFRDDCFCGVSCGYSWAIEHAPKKKGAQVR